MKIPHGAIRRVSTRLIGLRFKILLKLLVAVLLLLSFTDFCLRGFKDLSSFSAALKLGILLAALMWLEAKVLVPRLLRGGEAKSKEVLAALLSSPAAEIISVYVAPPTRAQKFIRKFMGTNQRTAFTKEGKKYHFDYRGRSEKAFRSRLYILQSGLALNLRQRHAIIREDGAA